MPNRRSSPEAHVLAKPTPKIVGFPDIHNGSSVHPVRSQSIVRNRRITALEPPARIRLEEFRRTAVSQNDVDAAFSSDVREHCLEVAKRLPSSEALRFKLLSAPGLLRCQLPSVQILTRYDESEASFQR